MIEARASVELKLELLLLVDKTLTVICVLLLVIAWTFATNKRRVNERIEQGCNAGVDVRIPREGT